MQTPPLDRVVFVDFDGVINTTRSLIARVIPAGFDPVACSLLNLFAKASSAKLVICSSWREHRTRAELADILTESGLDSSLLHDSHVTPILGRPRAEEVLAWLQEHGEVDFWVVIDAGIGLEELKPLVVQPSIDDGLLFNHIILACAVLNFEPWEWLKSTGTCLERSDVATFRERVKVATEFPRQLRLHSQA